MCFELLLKDPHPQPHFCCIRHAAALSAGSVPTPSEFLSSASHTLCCLCLQLPTRQTGGPRAASPGGCRPRPHPLRAAKGAATCLLAPPTCSRLMGGRWRAWDPHNVPRSSRVLRMSRSQQQVRFVDGQGGAVKALCAMLVPFSGGGQEDVVLSCSWRLEIALQAVLCSSH